MKSDIFSGNYLFHLHTKLTDGEPTVGEYFDYALSAGVDRLIFLEHIRREPTYDPADFAHEIHEASKASGVPASVGFEAKILPTGELDLSAAAVELADVVGIAEHGFSGDYDALKAAFGKVVAGSKKLAQTKHIVWAHPGLWFKKNKLMARHSDDYLAMLRLAQDAGIRIERNLRYDLVPEDILSEIDRSYLVLGADCHKMSELDRWRDASVSWHQART